MLGEGGVGCEGLRYTETFWTWTAVEYASERVAEKV